MDLQDIAKAISSKTRCDLLVLLDNPMSLNEVFYEYNRMNRKALRKETVYRHLEILVELNLIEKRYHQDQKRIKYKRIVKELRIDLTISEVKMVSRDDNNG